MQMPQFLDTGYRGHVLGVSVLAELGCPSVQGMQRDAVVLGFHNKMVS